MTIQRFSLPVISALTTYSDTNFYPVREDARDRFTIGEASDIPAWCDKLQGTERMGFRQGPKGAAWTNYMRAKEAKECTATGHKPSVEASDKFLAQLEDLLPAPTGKHVLIDDVVGAVPNVPAYLAGVPCTMRRKVRRTEEHAPIGIVVDCVTSAAISNTDMVNRGAAILALVRALEGRRPVELWVGAGLDAHGKGFDGKGTDGDATWAFFKLDTAPMDLARAAFLLGHPAFTRGIMYGMAQLEHDFQGGWPYGRGNSFGREHGREIVGRAMPHLEEMIWVPGAHVSDPTISDPIAWVRSNVAAYCGNDQIGAE